MGDHAGVRTRNWRRAGGLAIFAAGAALMVLADVAATSPSPSPSASPSPGTTQNTTLAVPAMTPPGVSPLTSCSPQLPNGTTQLGSAAFDNPDTFMNVSTVTENWYITSNGNAIPFAIASNTACWQEYHDASNYKLCVTDGGLSRIYDKLCTGVSSQEWNSGGNYPEPGGNYAFWIQNEYVNEHYGTCTHGPYLVGALAASGPNAALTMDCPGTVVPYTELWIWAQ